MLKSIYSWSKILFITIFESHENKKLKIVKKDISHWEWFPVSTGNLDAFANGTSSIHYSKIQFIIHIILVKILLNNVRTLWHYVTFCVWCSVSAGIWSISIQEAGFDCSTLICKGDTLRILFTQFVTTFAMFDRLLSY